MKDNLSYMKDFKPLNDKEKEAVQKVTEVFRNLDMIPCTACHYCVDENHCPKNIMIPDVFACLNSKNVFKDCYEFVTFLRVFLTLLHRRKKSGRT